MAKMSHKVREVRLRDFRCFHDEQTARLAPLTLLVGDNSTGKTSFLAAVRAIWQAAYQSTEPDFHAPPYDLGAFSQILHNPSSKKNRNSSFSIGFSGTGRRGIPIDFDVTFKSFATEPRPAGIFLKGEDVWIRFPSAKGTTSTIEYGSNNRIWRVKTEEKFNHQTPFSPSLIDWLRRELYNLNGQPSLSEKPEEEEDAPNRKVLAELWRILRAFSFAPRVAEPYASAPIRSSPRRTYDPTRALPDPEGAYVPTYFANINFQDKEKWLWLKDKLENFGQSSGLFHEIDVKQLGDMEGGPFQLEITKYGKNGKGHKRNLIDVGYGVSQVLPVIAELFRPDGSTMFLFQQPEVHLHPRAQAALGSLFCETAASGHQLLVETHSDYILDRILLDIRDKKTKLKSHEVSILFFERNNEDVTIHSIKIDKEGNVLNTPDGYRQFFKDELDRVFDY